jgi:hypothetical protein
VGILSKLAGFFGPGKPERPLEETILDLIDALDHTPRDVKFQVKADASSMELTPRFGILALDETRVRFRHAEGKKIATVFLKVRGLRDFVEVPEQAAKHLVGAAARWIMACNDENATFIREGDVVTIARKGI